MRQNILLKCLLRRNVIKTKSKLPLSCVAEYKFFTLLYKHRLYLIQKAFDTQYIEKELNVLNEKFGAGLFTSEDGAGVKLSQNFPVQYNWPSQVTAGLVISREGQLQIRT